MLNSVFERIIKDKNGVLVRVCFTVVDGKGQIVSIEPVQPSALSLPFYKADHVLVAFADFDNREIVSPYFSLDFLMSQPTRAPAFLY